MTRFALACLGLVAITAGVYAQAPSYSKQVQPFFNKYCVECHEAKFPDGGLSLHSYQGLLKGGENGKALAPGQPDQSKVLLVVEGKSKPAMPPKKSPQPKPEEVKILRDWIKAGAKEDGGSTRIELPDLKPRQPLAPPVSAVCYLPDGKTLVAAGKGEALLIDVAGGGVVQRLSGQPGQVTALATSRDGSLLAVASGQAGVKGIVRIYRSEVGKPSAWSPVATIEAHTDLIHDLDFSPDGRLLASAGYDRFVKLWDAAGKPVRELKDHSDSVYGVAFSPDGVLLASAGADRAVKVWEVQSGTRLYTLSESTDWVYGVAWHPKGKLLAATGVDRSVRVWGIDREGGKIVHSVFAHEAPVIQVRYSSDGQRLYTLSEDGGLKSWDAGRMVERHVYERHTESPLALAIRPDLKQLAVGRYDGKLVLLDEATGKTQAEPLPVRPKPPALKKLKPAALIRGQAAVVEAEGEQLDGCELVVSHPGTKVKGIGAGKFEVAFPATTPAGVYPVKLKNAAGESASLSLTVDLFAATAEVEPNDSPRTGQVIRLPATLTGTIGRAGEVDYFWFEARGGEEIGVQAMTTKLDPVVELVGPEGEVVAEGAGGLLGHTCATAGRYALGIRDRDYRGDPGMSYRLHVGPVPVITSVFPLGVRRGTETKLTVEGVHLGQQRELNFKAPAEVVIGSRLPLSMQLPSGEVPLGLPTVVVGEFPEAVAVPGKVSEIAVEGTGNGRLTADGASDTWKFQARKGDRLILEIQARRLGSPVDSYLEVLDGKGQPVPQAVLRSVARTWTTFRDHDSVGAGIRLETWGELAVNDYLYCGTELMQIRALPRNPDDDCRFVTQGGRRLGFLGTTPGQHPLGEPMYKVTINPPGSTFAPNGFPVVTLYYQNDDGGPGMDKDSRVVFDPPADGDYQVRVRDSRGEGSKLHAYRLTVRKPRPDFTVRVNPQNPSVWKGGALPLTVTVDRKDEFDGEVTLSWEGLPPGFSTPESNVPVGEESTVVGLFAEASATAPKQPTPLKLRATAMIDGKPRTVEATVGVPKLADPGDLVTTTEQSAVTIKPGQQARLKVHIQRRNGFQGRVPVDVLGLPHGVRVLDVGLNGILVTPRETSRTITLFCESWVRPTEHPVVVLSRREGKNTEHAAKPVLLRVAP